MTDLEKEKYALKLQIQEKSNALKEAQEKQKGISKSNNSVANKLEMKNH